MRLPVVAGRFYEDNEEELIKQIESCFLHKVGPGKLPELGDRRKIKGAIFPHAGFMASGPVAAHVADALAKDGFPDSFIIIGPSHTGQGSMVAITKEDFKTPFGRVEIDKKLAKKLWKGIIDNDAIIHDYEHSIEVILPFLQYIKKDIKFVPICMRFQDYQTGKEVGEIIRKAIKGRDVVVIASTDFTHYESQEIAEKKDKLAIEKILELDAKGLFEEVKKNNISMCGYGPVMAMLEAVQGEKATLIKYATSGDILPMKEVVGYGAFVIE